MPEWWADAYFEGWDRVFAAKLAATLTGVAP